MKRLLVLSALSFVLASAVPVAAQPLQIIVRGGQPGHLYRGYQGESQPGGSHALLLRPVRTDKRTHMEFAGRIRHSSQKVQRPAREGGPGSASYVAGGLYSQCHGA